MFEHEIVKGIPSALCACSLDGEEMSIFALSPRSVWLRAADEILPGGALTLRIYQPGEGTYSLHTPAEYQTGPVQRRNGAVLTRFCFDDPACAAAIRRMLNDYARCLEIKSCEGAAAYAAYISGYPEEADEIFWSSPELWRKNCFSSLAPLPELPMQCSLAVELNCPELWELYLQHPLPGFMAAYAALQNLPEGWLPNRLPDRLYIGNSYCRHLFPDEAQLQAIADKARSEGLALTLVTAELRSHSTSLAEYQLSFALKWETELAANDWGMLDLAVKQLQPGKTILGTMLNRRRKDPRMQYKTGLSGRENLLAANSLNDPGWNAFLKALGVSRFEFESCGFSMDIPAGSHSLHFPFFQTNTSLWCPLRALCLHGDRGQQADTAFCPQFCNRNMLVYPAHLKMLGRWNSLLALDERLAALSHPEAFDRWVLNF